MCGDFSSSTYLESAESGYEFVRKHNTTFANDGRENIVDDYCALCAATELYKATGKQYYKVESDRFASSLVSRLHTNQDHSDYWRADDTDRPFFHAADAGLPLVSLLSYLEIADQERRAAVIETVRKSLEFELRITEHVTNPFGYARQYVQNIEGERRDSFFFPHRTETKSWWQGENARLGSLAAAARLAAPHFRDDPAFQKKLHAYARNQLNWILGLNPFDVCMLSGSGRNNPFYMFFGSYQYVPSPGGICNGITASQKNEHDIDFNLTWEETGEDNDWRWVEQWLPHSSWFLVAVSAMNLE